MTLPLWPAHESGDADRRPGGRGQPPRRVTLVRLAGEIARSLADIGRVAVEGEVYRPQTYRAGRTYFTLRDRAAQMPVSFSARVRAPVPGRRRGTGTGGRRPDVGQRPRPARAGSRRGRPHRRRGGGGHDRRDPGPAGGRGRARPAPAAGAAAAPGHRCPVRVGGGGAPGHRVGGGGALPWLPALRGGDDGERPGAALSIIDGLRRLSSRPDVDVVVLARGGGDATALLPWSDEDLCRAVADCRVPVVSAIGHEADRPLCDEVADLRFGTPSIAAHAVVPDRARLEGELAALIEGAARLVDRRREMGGSGWPGWGWATPWPPGRQRAAGRLQHAADRLQWAHPGPSLQSCRARLDRCDWHRPMSAQLQSSRGRAEALGRHARSLSPQHVIERGFAVVRRLDGTVVRGPDQVRPG